MAIPKNKARTGGPRTPNGISRVSSNAIQTGAYSVHVILPGEDGNMFQQLLNGLGKDFNPRTTIENALVNDIAIVVWKKLRLEKAAHVLTSSRLSQPVTDDDLKDFFAEPDMPDGTSLHLQKVLSMAQHEALLLKAILPMMDEWRKHAETNNDYPGADPKKFAPLLKYFADYRATSMTDSATDATDATVLGLSNEAFSLNYRILAENDLRCSVWLINRRERLLAAVKEIKAGVVLDAMNNATTSRASEDLNRALYRALAELRKQQDWRLHVAVQEVS